MRAFIIIIFLIKWINYGFIRKKEQKVPSTERKKSNWQTIIRGADIFTRDEDNSKQRALIDGKFKSHYI